MDGDRYRNRTTTGRAALTALLALVLFGVLAGSAWAQAVPLSGSANPLPGSNFEGGDGNQVVDNPLRDDWADAVGVRHFPDPDDPDEVFTQGSKENEPGLWVINPDGTPSPPKNNIFDAYALVEETAGDTFLHLAFTRESAEGTTFMAFELNQRADLWNNGETATDIACRTTGDIIVTLQVQGNDPSVILQEWTTTATDPATGCATEGTLTDFTDFTDNVDAQGAVNDEPIANLLPASHVWPGGIIDTNLFVEASLNLTALLAELNDSPCFSFGSIWMHTRASLSDDSNMDDLISPEPLFIGNCTAEGVKYHDLNANGNQDAGEPGLGGFRIWADYDNDGVLDANEPFDDTDPVTGAYSIANIQPPPPDQTYSLREKLVSGAGTDGWICSEPTTTISNGPFPCAYVDINSATTPNVNGKDFGNYKNATVIVEKQTVPNGAAGSFAFTSTIPGKANFNLTDGQQNSTSVTPGVFAATETVPAGWTLTDITCSGDTIPPNSSDAGNTATFNAQSGETITCVFTNTKDAKVTIVKDAVPDDPQDFAFTGSFGPFTLDDDGAGGSATPNQTTFTVTAGNFGQKTVTESAVDGWTLTGLECSEGDENLGTRTATLQVDAGDDITCTFTNTKGASLTVVKVTDPASDPQDFDFDLTGSGVPGDLDLDTDAGSATPSQQTFPLNAGQLGAHTVTESALPDWDLTALSCTGAGPDSSTDLATRKATLDIDAGEGVVCTFTNTKRGEAIVIKTEGDESPVGEWTFTLDGVEQTTDENGRVVFPNLVPGTYTLCEVDIPDGWHSSLENVPGADVDPETGDVCVEITVGVGQTVTISVDNTKPDIEVDKTVRLLPDGTFAKTAFAHVGDTVEYRFEVTNPGVGALTVVFADPRCDAGTLTAPTGDADADGKLDESETWVYLCRHVITAQDPDPLPNTATVTGTDRHGNSDTDTSSAMVDVIHPAIDIEKTGPATATVGDLLDYVLTVTNPGDTPFAAQDVIVTDPKCEAPPAGPNTGSDASPNSLDPGDTWTYTCRAQTAGQAAGTFVNTANVSGKDFLGKTVTDTDDFPTVLNVVVVIPQAGSARLRGPSGCVRGPFNATVRGTRITRVTFFVDGKRFRVLTAPTSGDRFAVRINPRGRGFGVHRVTARVEFATDSGTRARTLRLSFQRCKRQVVRPRFTG